MDKRLERILPSVQKPARYTGGEYNEIIKDKSAVKLRMAFWKASLYVLPMLMTSPTARICVTSLSSAPLNFSNAHRANLITT